MMTSTTNMSDENPSHDETPNQPQEIENWDDLPDAKQKLLRGIYAYGFETPSPIQKKAIVPMFARRDVIAQAQSGTGKT